MCCGTGEFLAVGQNCRQQLWTGNIPEWIFPVNREYSWILTEELGSTDNSWLSLARGSWKTAPALKGSALPASGLGDVERLWIILFVLNGLGFSLCLSCLQYKRKLSPELQQLLPCWSCASSSPGPGRAAWVPRAQLWGSRSAQDLFLGILLNCSVVTALEQSGMGCFLLVLLKALTEGFLCPLLCLSIPGSALFPKCPTDWCSLWCLGQEILPPSHCLLHVCTNSPDEDQPLVSSPSVQPQGSEEGLKEEVCSCSFQGEMEESHPSQEWTMMLSLETDLSGSGGFSWE